MIKRREIKRWEMIGVLLFFISISSAFNFLTFDDYQKKLDKTIEKINETKPNSENIKLIEKKFKKTTQKKECKVKEDWEYFEMSPICFYNKEYPQLWLREAIDYIWPYIQWFDNEYDLIKTWFVFSWTSPIINYEEISLKNYYHDSPAQKLLISKLEENNKNIRIHKKYFAKYMIEEYSFYPVRKYTDNIWDCALTNYLLSLSALDWLYLKPWDIFNLNDAISYLPWYCKALQNYKEMWFYGWSCGTAWQLFRSTLITPYIDVLQRSEHIRRRADYYWDIIYWDDAAVSNWWKYLIIQNNNNFPIYYKTLKFKDYTYLVAILPYQWNEEIEIAKWPTSNLSAKVTKTLRKIKNKTTINTDEFFSKYRQYFKWHT